ncbi:HAMP domain-containing protein [Sinorhizobium medicae]|uniref:histidine kinase n=2 Tax=Sinorhizobium medicae TaxID=110321 RepID=A6U765_SINMW|nr:HAMP domain-containing sensor histidine kinase [Sinorhizobium medicae]ABR59495.1 integral membrane sensor signal transduction histidine kinase [Sinorhizobium medicae WSM419]MBO1939552.1 HAMP domain-containing histidine kinase [Sinorhizobium medicae]MBO1963219.1 HAMP domain-containing histidine kinase [Sinorhizobium medicae]MDX0409999.1 HAMP domain-containing protein [Sinorhizobium medicae]MDX0428920.1 HAMP domain-containing protein [Sinorhizobium medicae]
MSRIRVLFRTTAVRLSALYLVLFSLCAAFLVIYVTGMSERLLQQQTREAIAAEVNQISVVYDRAGINGLLRSLERRARQPGANLYVIAGPNGEILAGNVAALEPGLLDDEGWKSQPFRYRRFTDESQADRHVALAQVLVLDNGLRLLVGRDLQEPEKFRALVRQALMVALGIMGLGALVIWFGIGRNALRRIDRMSEASTKIMAGDLSQRLPASGSGDEFDRLSESLNAMLERIEKLNEGLKQVSDNIAHDLKTPLTRLRNKAEAALADGGEDSRSGALEQIIAESDQLIRTFNALLMISRVEAGSAVAEMSEVDLSRIVEDCVELYEPLAEDKDMRIEAEAAPGVAISGNRELISQALGNLVDNAIKYAEGAENPLIRVEMKRSDRQVVLTVADHGPGIPENMRGEVVKRFVRLDESRSKPGTGLGLSLVEAIMELHRGSLDLSATEVGGRGLTVRMVFPAAAT